MRSAPRTPVFRGAAALALALGVAACAAPPQADYPLSVRAREAPAPTLAPTGLFAEPMRSGTEVVARLGPERDLLAARAAALRARGEALSGAGLLDPAGRAKLERAQPN